MEGLTSQEAATRIGVNVQRWHRLVEAHGITPVFSAPGIRGAKYWRAEDVEMIRNAEAKAAS